jgi:hypothetical protein
MPGLQVFDRINSKNRIKLRSMDIVQYFNEMPLTKAQKKERISLAKELEDDITFFFYFSIVELEYFGYLSSAKQKLYDRLRSTVGKYVDVDTYMEEHLKEFTENMNRVTEDHLLFLSMLLNDENADEEKKKSEEYYVSDDRARFNGEEEANTIFNYADYRKAKKLGYRYKEWVSMRDSRVRKTHMEVDSRTIPIDDFFVVGDCVIRYPRDFEYGTPKEIIGCRCVLKYHK